MSIKLGDKDIPFVMRGGEVLEPNPVREGLVLWYDFKGMTNTDVSKGVAQDLSGNGNDGELQNFAYADGSGYQDGGLKFDGVDDYLNATPTNINYEEFSLEVVVSSDSYSGNRSLIAVSEKYTSIHNSTGFGLTYISNPQTVYASFHADGENQLKLFYGEETFMKKHFVLVGAKNTIYFYVDGVLSDSHSYTDLQTELAAGMPLRIANGINGGVGSAKLYLRPLTPEEVAHNYAIEKERFGL